jgi:hypothetical protein
MELLANNGNVINTAIVTNNEISIPFDKQKFMPSNQMIINDAKINSGNNLTITTNQGDIKNIGGNIESNGNIELSANNGNVVNTAIVATNDVNLLQSNSDSYQLLNGQSPTTTGNITSTLLQNASIKGGSVSINADNDFNNLAASISTTKNILADGSTTSGNLSINAGDDINITTLQLHNRIETSWGGRKKGGSEVIDTTTNLASNINIGGNLTATTTGLSADVVADEGSNINISGSNVSTTGNLTLVAKDGVNVISAQDSSYKYSDFHKKGSTVQKFSKDISQDLTNVSSNLTSIGDINITSGKDTNIIASNLSGTNGNILVGKYTDNNPLSSTYGQEIINNYAQLTIKSGQDYHYKYHEETKIKTDLMAVGVGAVAAAVVVAATGGAALAVVGAAAGGATTGAGGKKGKTSVEETTKIVQVSSDLNFANNLNIQSASNTNITASNLTADSATILTGKFRNVGGDTIVNTDAKLNINSVDNITKTYSRTDRVKPNYAGVAVVAAGSALTGQAIGNYLTSPVGDVGPVIPITSIGVVSGVGAGYAGISGALGLSPDSKSIFDPLINIRSLDESSSIFRSKVNSSINFNNLTTQ